MLENKPRVTVTFEAREKKVKVNHNLKQGWDGAVEMLEEGLKVARAQRGKIISPVGGLILPGTTV